MAPRTDTVAVSEVLDTSLDDGTLSAYISAAGDVVDDIADRAPETDADTLERIERFYAAYLATASDPRAERQSGGARSVSYRDIDGDGNASHKQVAIALDPTDTIASAGLPNASISSPSVKRGGRR